MRLQLAAVTLVACGSRHDAGVHAVANLTTTPITFTATAAGPIHDDFTKDQVRSAFSGSVVEQHGDGGDELWYEVIENGAPLLRIDFLDGRQFVVTTTSPKVIVADHPWRVGAPLGTAVEVRCRCWNHRGPVCFRDNEHVAVGFAYDGDSAPCSGCPQRSADRGPCGAVVDGSRFAGADVASLIWSRDPLRL